ncbi:LytR/AlgR family response regulator transcription factor [Algoriphagus terrigena]|uniref:LytR/AlgR family response regulator transcription factor n=1 Tax=Algoriphagus terrigena TaxID=344884 RepID=UPI000413B166|nr:response regulator transcription factor [Algoriphagus terrigena]
MEKELKCLLLDDELPGLTYLKMLCEQIPGLTVVKSFNDPSRFLEEFPALEFDLCILDIEMPQFDGLKVANLLQGKAVIFATAYKEYAAEAFDLNAVDYLRKPVSLDRLKRAIDKARIQIDAQQETSRFFSCNTDKGKALIPVDQLAWIGTSPMESRDKTAHLKDGTLLLLKNISFETLQLSLPKGTFVRINKQEMINLDIVRFFSHDQITTVLNLESGKALTLTLSERFREEFLRKVNS